MNLNENDPRLPIADEPEWQAPRYGHRLAARLYDLFRQNAAVTREIQTPPAFHVSRNTSTITIPGTGTITQIPFNNVEFDTHNRYSTSTYRYTPPESGYYLFTAVVTWNLTFTGANGYPSPPRILLRKNGTAVKVAYVGKDCSVGTAQLWSSSLHCVMYHDASANKSGGADYWDMAAQVSRGDGFDEIIVEFAHMVYWSGHFIGARRSKYE